MTLPPRPLGDPLRVVGGELDVVALDQIGGLQLVYSPRSETPPVAVLLTPRQAADLAARLLEWAGPQEARP